MARASGPALGARPGRGAAVTAVVRLLIAGRVGEGLGGSAANSSGSITAQQLVDLVEGAVPKWSRPRRGAEKATRPPGPAPPPCRTGRRRPGYGWSGPRWCLLSAQRAERRASAPRRAPGRGRRWARRGRSATARRAARMRSRPACARRRTARRPGSSARPARSSVPARRRPTRSGTPRARRRSGASGERQGEVDDVVLRDVAECFREVRPPSGRRAAAGRHRVEQRGLSRAARADDRHQFSRRDGQRYVLQRDGSGPYLLRQRAHLDRSLHGPHSASSTGGESTAGGRPRPAWRRARREGAEPVRNSLYFFSILCFSSALRQRPEPRPVRRP